MNSSIIIDDIRKRSIRVQRDQMIERLKQEEEFFETSVPKRIIMEAEERAREKVQSQGWKKTFVFVVFMIACAYLIFRYIKTNMGVKPQVQKQKKKMMITTEIQTDPVETPVPEKRAVKFSIDEKMERIKLAYPDTWKEFERNVKFPWLRSPISGPMFVDFYLEDERLAIDVIHNDMLEYPNIYHTTEEQFENYVYERKLKMDQCQENDVSFMEMFIGN